MPASTKASYVGRLAPPGRPNTTSTPSALRHSITASTARIASPSRGRIGGRTERAAGGRLRRQCSPNPRAGGGPGPPPRAPPARGGGGDGGGRPPPPTPPPPPYHREL